jgi:hypothetical protein
MSTWNRENARPGWLVTFALAAVTATLTSCGGENPSEAAGRPSVPRSDAGLQEAERFLAAANELRLQSGDSVHTANDQVNDELQGCPSLAKGHPPALQQRVDAVTTSLGFTEQNLVIAGPYAEYAERLTSIAPSNEALRTLVASVQTIAEEARRVRSQTLDICDELEAWKRSGWSESEQRRLQGGIYSLFGVDQNKLREAGLAASETKPSLQRLGLSFEETTEITASAIAFG